MEESLINRLFKNIDRYPLMINPNTIIDHTTIHAIPANPNARIEHALENSDEVSGYFDGITIDGATRNIIINQNGETLSLSFEELKIIKQMLIKKQKVEKNIKKTRFDRIIKDWASFVY